MNLNFDFNKSTEESNNMKTLKNDKLITEALAKETFGEDKYKTLLESGEVDKLIDDQLLNESTLLNPKESDLTNVKQVTIMAIAEEHKNPLLLEMMKAQILIDNNMKALSEEYDYEAELRLARIKTELKDSRTLVGQKLSK